MKLDPEAVKLLDFMRVQSVKNMRCVNRPN